MTWPWDGQDAVHINLLGLKPSLIFNLYFCLKCIFLDRRCLMRWGVGRGGAGDVQAWN